MTRIKHIMKNWVPPAVWRIASRLKNRKYGWFGPYATWEEAVSESTGYDSSAITDKVKEALIRVRNGEAVFERDGVIFNEPDYSWPLVASLLYVAAQKKGELDIIDFGGSLGSTYFQNSVFIDSLSKVRWNIVEQGKFVEIGLKDFQDQRLFFFDSLDKCLNVVTPSAILFGSVLQYIEQPYELLNRIIDRNIEFIIIDRTLFFEDKEMITIHKVDPAIYTATIPTRILNFNEVKRVLLNKYNIIAEYNNSDIIKVNDEYARCLGLICKLK